MSDFDLKKPFGQGAIYMLIWGGDDYAIPTFKRPYREGLLFLSIDRKNPLIFTLAVNISRDND